VPSGDKAPDNCLAGEREDEEEDKWREGGRLWDKNKGYTL